MGKRAASRPAENKAKEAKEAKVVDPFFEELSPVLALVDEASEADDSCREMLKAMAPHALRACKEERHPYQATMVDVLEKVLIGVKVELEETTAAARKLLADAEAQQETSSGTLADATEKAEQQKKEKDAKDATQLDLEAALTVASATLGQEEEREKNLEGDQAKIVKEKGECEKFMSEKWEQLKAGSFAGKDWRERNKTIDTTLQVLSTMGLDVSLRAALPTALKTKPGERGKFASNAVEFAEVVMNRHLTSLGNTIANFDQEAASRAQATAAAKEAVKLAETALEEGKAAAKAAEESLCSCLQTQATAEAAMKAAPKVVAKNSAALEQDKAALKHAEDVLSIFATLRERSKAALAEPGKVEEEVISEEAAPMEKVDAQMDAVPAQ
eukprot:TRINITY_DN4538_c0_g1_i1.p1 TRINITY_DN4538_c0_g1~~TRINITY_DN4538_c0_g1_i1.p1  ORF type:complete len:409 (+),score=158.09 TRINITY_DN4538_c0_g1_i1:68-1228(+)